MIIDLISRPFDIEVFNTFPKCRGDWGGMYHGCLITAFLKAMGISLFIRDGSDHGIYWKDDICLIDQITMMIAIEDLASKVFGPGRTYINSDGEGTPHFVNALISLYDSGLEFKASALIWELIDKLPNKVNHNKTIKDFVSNGWTQEGDENSLVFTRKPKCLAGKQ